VRSESIACCFFLALRRSGRLLQAKQQLWACVDKGSGQHLSAVLGTGAYFGCLSVPFLQAADSLFAPRLSSMTSSVPRLCTGHKNPACSKTTAAQTTNDQATALADKTFGEVQMACKKMMKRRSTEAAKYEPTPQERVAYERFLARSSAQSSAPIKITKNGHSFEFVHDHPNERVAQALVMDALGTADLDFVDGILSQLFDAASKRQDIDERSFNFLLSVIKGIGPRDQIEAMLAAQMAVVQLVTMTFGGRLARADTIPQQDSAERAFNKLTRTFVAQMEALKRYRNGGEQRMAVQNVSVNDGGQAIVGNVMQNPV
jgi:hypothetical protein